MSALEFKQSLAYKFNRFTVIVAVIILILLVLYLSLVANGAQLTRINQALTTQSQSIISTLRNEAFLLNAQTIVVSLSTPPTIKRVSLFNPVDYRIIADSQAQLINTRLSLSVPQFDSLLRENNQLKEARWNNIIYNDTLYFFQPLLSNTTSGNVLDSFVLMYQYDLSADKQAIEKQVTTYLTVTAFGFILLLVVCTLNLRHQVLIPIKRLSQVISNDTIPTAPFKEPANELSELANACNSFIDNRLQHEHLINESRRQKDAVAYNVPVLLAYINSKMSITFANQRFLAWTGKTTDDIYRLNFKTIMKQFSNADFEPLIPTTLQGTSHKFECLFKFNSHLERHVVVNLIPDINEMGKVEGIIACIEDNTQVTKQRKELEDYARKLEVTNVISEQAKYNAEKAEKTKADFLACMSHEIRTPMNGIIGMLDILKRSEDNPKRRGYLNLADTSAHNLLVLINDILDFSKIESGKLTIENIPFSLKEEIINSVNMMKVQADEKRVAICIQPEILNNHNVIGDPNRFKQIMINLLSNAIKFTDQGTIIVSPIFSLGENDILHFSCSIVDEGIGITPEQQKSLFKPFTQADSSTTRQFGGTGLGLAIVKQLCHLMNGNIEVESTFGAGSTFTFNLSFTISKNMPTTKGPTSAPNHEITFANHHKLLLVEDNKINQIVAQKALSELSITVDTANNGQEAIEKLRLNSEQYSLILMDCLMPELDGYQATDAIRKGVAGEQCSDITIVAMTANAMKGDREKCLSVGMDDYIAKPVRLKELKQVLAKWLKVTSN